MYYFLSSIFVCQRVDRPWSSSVEWDEGRRNGNTICSIAQCQAAIVMHCSCIRWLREKSSNYNKNTLAENPYVPLYGWPPVSFAWIQLLCLREMEYIERSSYNTLYPFQNKHQIHWHLQCKVDGAYVKIKTYRKSWNELG